MRAAAQRSTGRESGATNMSMLRATPGVAQRSQGQANAHLAMGVTTIVGLSDDRRGLLMEGDPEPHIKRLEDVTGYDLSQVDPAPQTIEGFVRSRR